MFLILAALASPARAEDLFVAGPDDLGLGNGISVADVDGDGWVDIVVPSAMSLWTNQAGEGWLYTDIPFLHGYTAGQYGASLGDYDRDGLPHLVTEPRGGYAELLQNTGGEFELFSGGYFADPPGSQDAETAAWIDADGDGRLDVLVPAYYGKTGFWHNLADGTGGASFEQVATEVGLVLRSDDSMRPEGAQFVDIDRDGDPDLYVCGELFRNQSTPGAPWFEAQPDSGIEPAFDEGAAFADVDMDGDFDLGVLYMDHYSFPDRPVRGMSLYENLGDGTFAPMDLDRVDGHDDVRLDSLEEGLSFADWDNDGDPDLTFTDSFAENQWRETGDVRFTAYETSAADDDTIPAWFDADLDGDLDLARATYGGSARFYENALYDGIAEADRHVLRVRAVDDSDAIAGGIEDQFGATVELRVAGSAPEVRRRQFVASGHGYLNQSEYTLSFGLEGADALTAEVTVDFPNAADEGVWRIDPVIQPALAAMDVGSRTVTVYRSGAAVVDGVRYEPSEVESPILVTAGGVPPTTDADAPEPAPDGTWVGVEVHVPVEDDVTRVAALREVLVEGVLAAPVTCGASEGNVLVWDVTPGLTALVSSATGAVLPSNRRVDVAVDGRLTQGHTYRVLARVASVRDLPAGVDGSWVEVNGAVRAADVDACDGAAITGAELDTTTRSVSIRWRERTDGTPDEVYVEPTDTGEDTGTVVDTADDSAPDTADSAASRDDSGGSAGGPSPEGCGCASAAAARAGVGVLVLAMGWGVRRRRASGAPDTGSACVKHPNHLPEHPRVVTAPVQKSSRWAHHSLNAG